MKWKPCERCARAERFNDSNERRDEQLLQVIYFVNKYEAIFSTERLKISKWTWIKSLLETNFTSSLKPTIIIIANLKYKP